MKITYHLLENVNNIKFTAREIDIISFIIHGRSAKKIASTLNLSQKTVENYTHNIKLKINCNSQEGIRDFIEQSDKSSLFRKLYQYSTQKSSFEEWAKINKKFIERYGYVCLVISKGQKTEVLTVQDIERDLTCCGFKVLRGQEIVWDSIILPADIKDSIDCVIYCLESNLIDKASNEGTDLHKKILSYIEKLKIAPQCIIAFNSANKTTFKVSSSLAEELSNFEKQNTTPQIINPFKPEERKLPTVNKYLTKFKMILNIKYKTLCGILLGILIFVFLCFKENTNQLAIHADLPLPSETFLLKRPQIIKQIESTFENQNKDSISTIALIGVVGIGGAGKTTLTRYYGNFVSNASITWEINAETKENLINSFKELAYRLATTKEKREELAFIQNTQNTKEKETQLLFFIQYQLKQHNNWLLIYDNVDSLSELKEFFPRDVKM